MNVSQSRMPSTYSLTQILVLEDDPELLGYHCPGTTIPAWALIRVEFIRTIMSDLLYKSASLAKAYQQRRYKQVVSYVVRTVAHNAFYRNDYSSEICLFSSGVGNFSHNSQTLDRLASYFASTYPENSLIYQDHGGWGWHGNFHFPRILYSAPFDIYSRLVGRLGCNPQQINLAEAVIERAVTNARVRLNHEVRPNDVLVLKRSLAQQLAELPFVVDYYSNWFARRNTKLLLKEGACYGARSIPIVMAAKLAGAKTAEYQHGAISLGHDGYNVASTLATSSYFQQTLPEYFLAYGEWWGKQINMPLQHVVIGNPHFTESTKHITDRCAIRDGILILGAGIETDIYINLAERIATIARGRGMRVFFRPHPLERHRAQHAELPPGVELDKNSDVYESFAVSSIVISEMSTGLFEAAGLVDRVVMWNTEKARFAFPQLPFASFTNIDELEEVLFGSAKISTDFQQVGLNARSQIWANGWQTNYKNFVESVLKK